MKSKFAEHFNLVLLYNQSTPTSIAVILKLYKNCLNYIFYCLTSQKKNSPVTTSKLDARGGGYTFFLSKHSH